jgi:O-antigen/teichoic acid export membrane protein
MKWRHQIMTIIHDPVRLAQWFMLCRHAGIFLSSIVIARVLPIEEVGVFEMLMLSGYLMTFFWSEALLKGFLANKAVQQDKSMSSGFLWLYMAFGLFSMLLLIAGSKILIPLFTDRVSLDGLGWFALYQAMIIVVWIAPFAGAVSIKQKQVLSALVLTGPTIASLIGLSIWPELKGILLGLTFYALTGLLITLSQIRFFKPGNIYLLWKMIWPATWPLVMYAISTGLARSFDSWLVARHFDDSAFAIFRYGAREFPLVVALAGGLSTIMIPKLISNDALGELKLRSTRLMHICYPAVFVILLVSPFVFVWFFGAGYQPAAYLFNIYLLITLTQLMFPQSIITARGDTRLLWYVSIAELIVNIVASLILLSYFGLEGIAFGTLIAFAFEKVILLLLVARRYGISPGQFFNPYMWLAYAVLLVIAFNAAKWIAGI